MDMYRCRVYKIFNDEPGVDVAVRIFERFIPTGGPKYVRDSILNCQELKAFL